MQQFSIQRLTYAVVLLCIFTYILIIGQSIIQPLVFAGLFMVLSLPITGFYEKYLPTIPSIFLTLFTVMIPVGLVLYGMSSYFVMVFTDLPSIGDKISKGAEYLLTYFSDTLGMTKTELKSQVEDNSTNLLSGPMEMIGSGVSASTGIAASIFLTMIYTFLLLLYRSSFKEFFLSQFSDKNKQTGKRIVECIRTVTQDYLYGMLVVMLILGILNSLGLFFIGIEYAFFWGFLAALLAIIPYVGTFVGGLLPFLFALATTGTLWQPFSVVLLFGLVQVIEGNLITPKIVGSSVELNPLAAILSLVIGNAIWGIGGMVLAIPVMAIIRVIIGQVDALRPLSMILSSKVYEKEEEFANKFDEKKFRLINLFSRKKV